MSILIKGMEMARKCSDCLVLVYGRCLVNNDKDVSKAMTDAVRDEDCPLVPIPPHGDLIDRDALMKSESPIKKMMMFGGQYVFAENEIKNAPIVIPAEEGE